MAGVPPDFGVVIGELETKYEQLRRGAELGRAPSRKELETFIWKTARVLRKIIVPEKSEARKIYWSECKGFLQQVMVMEKFNPGVFVPECIRLDVVESHLMDRLSKLISYTKGRRSGRIAAPKEVHIERPEDKKRKLEAEEHARLEREAEKGKGSKIGKGKTRKKDVQALLDEMPDELPAWGDEDSDPDEPCPDLVKLGRCTYGRQCGFCHRVLPTPPQKR